MIEEEFISTEFTDEEENRMYREYKQDKYRAEIEEGDYEMKLRRIQ